MQAFAVVEKFVDVAGARVRYLEAGTGEPLLLVHGLGQSSSAWKRVLPGLSDRRRVIALDMPGFGGSVAPPQAPFEPEYFARVIDGLAAALEIERMDAIGHSAGGLTLLLDALWANGRYGKLVLVDPAGFTPAPDNLLGTAAVSLARLLVSIPRSRTMTRALYSTAFYDARNVDEDTVDELIRRRADPSARLAARRAFGKYFDYCRHLEPFHMRLAALERPVLVVWGSDDRLFRSSDAAVAKRVLPAARVEVFERCGHCPQIEYPERFIELVTEFLAAS